MPYSAGNQTQRYPHIGQHYKTTNEHFHDEPNAKEPHKSSTFGKLYANSTYFMDRRLEPRPMTRAATTGGGAASVSLKMESEAPLTWTGRLSSSYVGNGTFQLLNGLTYSTGSRSAKPVKLASYGSLMKTEYQDKFNRTAAAAEHPLWSSGRAPLSATYQSRGRFAGL